MIALTDAIDMTDEMEITGHVYVKPVNKHVQVRSSKEYLYRYRAGKNTEITNKNTEILTNKKTLSHRNIRPQLLNVVPTSMDNELL